MKTYFSAIVLFLVITQCGYAQAKASPAEDLSDSSRALQFQITDNFSLSSFQGSVFSYMHHFTKERALRIGLSVSVGGNNLDQSDDQFWYNQNSLTHIRKYDIEKNSTGLQLSTQYIWYLNPGSRLLLFSGAGPFLRYDRSFEKNETSYPQDDTRMYRTTIETQSSQWTPGASGIVGVEWFASKAISFSAEYGLQLSYFWNESKITTKTQNNNSVDQISNAKSKGWNLAGSSVKFGLSLYFQ
ncbi:MAG: hypothetical protein ACM3UR_14190 [Bacteroidota bacterium]|jgi:hypothetical protein|nr:hypothetical protein [Ignavibacteria bacterium]MCU7499509.1 hypothetical protein [Ignavibacteria bacterium]MCU7511443.1 hypothetical protein [Ignavibacteria bacterium]MCU7519440.1 hypothetical protein [Ignavibacteria bacterium]MCU7524677.1 hypothetical protein [Ignavibacteria bacterium]